MGIERLGDRLEDAIREALKPHLYVGRKVTTDLLETVTEAAVAALRQGFAVGTRHRRPRRETHRALMMRLPEVGVCLPFTKRGQTYHVRIVGENAVDLEREDGTVVRYETLKAVATAIAGYTVSVSGWQYFFGGMSREEVSARYGAVV